FVMRPPRKATAMYVYYQGSWLVDLCLPEIKYLVSMTSIGHILKRSFRASFFNLGCESRRKQ
ncbi:MAG: hypothetical protein ACJ07L_17250, partial [Opitutales bacterium]